MIKRNLYPNGAAGVINDGEAGSMRLPFTDEITPTRDTAPALGTMCLKCFLETLSREEKKGIPLVFPRTFLAIVNCQ